MEKHYIYNRCSTEGQDFLQQQKCVLDYLERLGIVADEVVTEKVSGTVTHKERKLAELLDKCQGGDTIYVSELSRLGRCMSDLFALVSDATNRGIKLVQCKDGSVIEAESIGGKALLFALSLAAEIEVANIRQRTQMALDARKDMIEREGGFISKAGNWCTKLGRDVGCDLSVQNQASAKARTDAKIAWLMDSIVGKYVQQRWQQGWSFVDILADLDRLYEMSPDVYCSRQGCKIGKGQLSKMLNHYRDMGYVAMPEKDRRRS